MPEVRLPVLAADASVDAVEAALREAGCAVVERLVPAEQLDRVAAELEPHLLTTEPGADEFTGRNTRRRIGRPTCSTPSPRTP